MDENRDNLGKILDLLGPNMWLVVDEVSFSTIFGCRIDASSEERERGFAKARAFADRQGAVFIGEAIKKKAGLADLTSRTSMIKPPKRPRDMNQWTSRMVELATGEAGPLPVNARSFPAARV